MTPNPIQSLGMGILIPYLFVLYSRIFDIKFAGLHIPMLMATLLIILSAASMQAFGVMSRTRIGQFLGWFTLWAIVGIPFSVWRTGAFVQATQVWPRALLVFVAIGCLVTSLQGLRRAIFTLGFGIVILGLISRILGQMQDGRLFLPTGKLSNPNDLAQAVLMGFPFLLFILMEGNKVMKCLVVLGAVPMFQALVRTGSRGGMLGFLVILLFVFFRSSLGGKVMAVAGGIAVFVLALAVLPESLLVRYVTLFHPADAGPTIPGLGELQDENLGNQTDIAAASANERYELIKEAIQMSLHHPIFGVGMGQFATARDKEASARGLHVPWRVPHNSYVEVSSETGIVGLVLYMIAFVGSIRMCWQLGRFAKARAHPQWKLISSMTFCLQMSLLSYAVTSFFASVAYEEYVPTLAGLTLALMQSVAPEFKEWENRSAVRVMMDFRPRRIARVEGRAA
jgi:O-antigen ligase